jgi:hypothetical protein
MQNLVDVEYLNFLDLNTWYSLVEIYDKDSMTKLYEQTKKSVGLKRSKKINLIESIS